MKNKESDGHGVSSGEDAVPDDPVFIGEMAGGQEDPRQPVTEEQKKNISTDGVLKAGVHLLYI